MLHSILPRTRLLRRQRVSSASAFPIARPKVPSANVNRKSDGSATARSGVPDVKGASALPSGDMVSAVAATRDLSEWTAGSALVSSPTTSSTSVARWRSSEILNSHRHPRIFKPAGHPRRALLYPAQTATMPQTSILRREVARLVAVVVILAAGGAQAVR